MNSGPMGTEFIFLEEEFEVKRTTISSVIAFAKHCKGKLIASVLFAILSVASGFLPYIGAYQIILLFFNEQASAAGIFKWVLISAVGYFIKLICYGISTTLSHISAYKILETIRIALTDQLMKVPLGQVLSDTAGNLKNIIVDRVETIELPLAHMIPEGISNLVMPLAIFIYLFHMNWMMALATLICIPLGAVVYGGMMNGYNEQYERYMKASDYVNSVIVEYIEGIQVIKAFNRSSGSYEKYRKAVTDFRDFTLAWFDAARGLMNLGGALLPSILVGVLPVGVLLYTQGMMTPAEFTLSIILSMSMISPVSWFTEAVNNYKFIEYAINDVNQILDMPVLENKIVPVRLENYDIALNHVSFAYHPIDDCNKTSENVLEDINLQLPQGCFTALVGPSGSGKSTVARLIARFWEVYSGSITIGGKPIKEIPLSQLSQMISFVTQDNFLFNCSILENIRLGKVDATDEEVYAAAQAANCDEFINKLEKGYHTTAGEAGGKLSGGERQRIALARAILKNAPIVILDEATAFTDPENEAQIQKSIAILTKGKTLLVIAHRLSTIKNADQIVVLQKGQVVAKGTQQDLLVESELYRKMWQAHIGAKNWAAATSQEEDAYVSNC